MSNKCELCKLVEGKDIKTRLYHRDKVMTIVSCLTCGIPMVVLNHHGEATENETELMQTVVDHLFSYRGIRKKPRKIPYHVHWHIIGAHYRNIVGNPPRVR